MSWWRVLHLKSLGYIGKGQEEGGGTSVGTVVIASWTDGRLGSGIGPFKKKSMSTVLTVMTFIQSLKNSIAENSLDFCRRRSILGMKTEL